MRRELIVIGAGLLSGAVGAFVVVRFAGPAAPSAAPTSSALPAPKRPAPVLIVPPAWDPELEPRLRAVEKELSEKRSAQDGTEPPPVENDVEPTEEDRIEHYQLELAAQNERLADHNREPVDPDWARERSRSLRERLSLSPSGIQPEIVDVDCRSLTCTATLSFSSPMDGIAFIQSKNNTVPTGCSGMIATPPPPTGEEAYEMTILYTCDP